MTPPASAPESAGRPLEPFLGRWRIACFTMEIAIREEMRTYAGGLGILAGNTARSAADIHLPRVFVTLVSRAGYFRLPPRDWRDSEPRHDVAEVRERVSSPPTPRKRRGVSFDYALFERPLPAAAPLEELQRLASQDALNMTRLGLNLSGHLNGVARRHALTTQKMVPRLPHPRCDRRRASGRLGASRLRAALRPCHAA